MNLKSVPNSSITTQTAGGREHLHVLDGLRGIAALVVLVFHYFEPFYFSNPAGNPIGHGHLAVDFFFCLSGFVIGYAYDARMKSLGFRAFCVNRLIRLHPLIVFSMVIGILAFIFDPFIENPFRIGWQKFSISAFCSFFLIPDVIYPRTHFLTAPFNPAAWSMFFEYMISIFYAILLIRLNKRVLGILTILFAAALVYHAHDTGWINSGWGKNNFMGGFIRVAFPFTAGLLAFRLNWVWKNKFSLYLSGILLLIVLASPHRDKDWITESILIILVMPMILIIGAGAKAKGITRKVCRFIGDLSYPLYITHSWTLMMFIRYLRHNNLNLDNIDKCKMAIIITLIILFNIAFAYFALRFVDKPIRKWLNKRRT